LGYFVWKITILRQKIILFPIAEGGAKILGYFVWKITILHQKIIFFPILGGGRAPPESAPAIDHHIVCSSSTYGFWIHLCHLQLFLDCLYYKVDWLYYFLDNDFFSLKSSIFYLVDFYHKISQNCSRVFRNYWAISAFNINPGWVLIYYVP
jgi:hypothetical protein